MKLNAHYVTINKFDDLYFDASSGNEQPGAGYDPDASIQRYVLLQRQFEDDNGGVCYLETQDPDATVI